MKCALYPAKIKSKPCVTSKFHHHLWADVLR